jgi:hypothetical protein
MDVSFGQKPTWIMSQTPPLDTWDTESDHASSVEDDLPSLPQTPGEELSELSAALVLPNRPDAPTVRRVIEFLAKDDESAPESLAMSQTPWTLQRFFDGDIDLDAELAQRFPNAKMLSTIHFRSLGSKSKRGVATLTSPDGSGQMIVDVDGQTKQMQISVTYGAMLTLRFTFEQLGDAERMRWVELMRRKEGGLAFLWGPTRWEQDYMICVVRRYFSNLYIFSPRNFEAAIRLTPDVTRSLVNWLEGFWKDGPAKSDSAPLLTW